MSLPSALRARVTHAATSSPALLLLSSLLGGTAVPRAAAAAPPSAPGCCSRARALASASAASAAPSGKEDTAAAEARRSGEAFRKEMKRLRKEYYRNSIREEEERRRERESARGAGPAAGGAGAGADADRRRALEAAVRRAKAAREEARAIAKELYSVDAQAREEMRAQKAANAREVQEKTDALKRLALRSLNEKSKTWITDEPTLRAKIREAMERVMPLER